MPTLLEHKLRLQLFMCCFSSKGDTISNQLRIGAASCCDLYTFELLSSYWKVLVCFNPEEPTCLTQKQVDKIWEDISCKCGICFPIYGTTLPPIESYRISTETLIQITTEDSNYLIV